jgi:hypothetical protein
MKRKTKSEPEKVSAEKWQTTVRTIRRWRKAGAPLGNEAKMLDWLHSTRRFYWLRLAIGY